MTTVTEEKKHSPLSASGAERWLSCAASVGLSKVAPVPPSSKWADEGTLAHAYLEKWLRDLVKGKTHLPASSLIKNSDMLNAVQSAVKDIGSEVKKTGAELLVETKVSLAHIHPTMFGTTDVGLVSLYDSLKAWDYKHGKGYAVDVAVKLEGRWVPNPQLMYYLLGLAHQFDFNFSTYQIGILQPRAPHKHGPSRRLDVTRNDLYKFEDTLKAGVDRVFSKKPKVVQGKWCHWCPAKDFNCPKFEQVRIEKYRDDFADLPEEDGD
jgi:hypothetical protein